MDTEYLTDKRATALLKLIYLEMFGYDMSWAAFNVLEVMSSAKYLQKRVGYLGAVQSFRPDTEVLMLATNMLKKVESAFTRLLHTLIAYSFNTLLTHIGHRFAQYPRSVITSSNSTTYHHPIAVHVSPS